MLEEGVTTGGFTFKIDTPKQPIYWPIYLIINYNICKIGVAGDTP